MRRAYAVLGLCATITFVASGQNTFTTVASFNGSDGQNPTLPPIQGTDGQGYGTTFIGGNGYGVVFKFTSSGHLSTLYSFCSVGLPPNCLDGEFPFGLVQSTDQYFYGTTNGGGAHGNFGTVFKISPTGTLTTLYNFCTQSGCMDGQNPYGPLIQASTGLLYGTTSSGGANGGGTVFQITPGGTLTTLYHFCSVSACADGQFPQAPLIQAGNGNLYGTTTSGGETGAGTIFEITLNGTLTTLYTFSGPDGRYPWGLVQGNDGNFYGTTQFGGAVQSSAPNGSGTIFKLTPKGVLTTLHSFCSEPSCSDGQFPFTGPVLGSDGSIYGTTTLDGSRGEGTAYQVTTDTGTLTIEHNFCDVRHCSGQSPVQEPSYGLGQDTTGVFYGTTFYGGTGKKCTDPSPFSGCGTIYSLDVGLGAFVKPQPAVGKVGATIDILGTSLTGATSVTFNGTTASFTVSSDTLIVATVPAKAESGTIAVVTPGGTLMSNVFSVLR